MIVTEFWSSVTETLCPPQLCAAVGKHYSEENDCQAIPRCAGWAQFLKACHLVQSIDLRHSMSF